jgi:hypothetical protein
MIPSRPLLEDYHYSLGLCSFCWVAQVRTIRTGMLGKDIADSCREISKGKQIISGLLAIAAVAAVHRRKGMVARFRSASVTYGRSTANGDTNCRLPACSIPVFCRTSSGKEWSGFGLRRALSIHDIDVWILWYRIVISLSSTVV